MLHRLFYCPLWTLLRNGPESLFLDRVWPAGLLQIVDRKLRYVSEPGHLIQAKADVSDGKQHHVVLSHRYAQGETLLFVDGRLTGTISERVEPKRFVLGASRGSHDFREWLVYRAALNETEVEALHGAKLLQASLEVYAPLTDKKFEIDGPVENRAQSLSEVIYTDRPVSSIAPY